MEYIIPKITKKELDILDENDIDYFKDNSEQDIFVIADAFLMCRILNLLGRTKAIKLG